MFIRKGGVSSSRACRSNNTNKNQYNTQEIPKKRKYKKNKREREREREGR
jgi:hypothetical protein